MSLAEIGELAGLPRARWPRPDGTYPEGPGPEVDNHAQLLRLIALGRTMMTALDSCRAQLREDVVAIPVADAADVTTVIAWPPRSRNRAVAGLVRTAVRL